MFDASVYQSRRSQLQHMLKSGLVVLLGHDDLPMNYGGNPFHFRQDSTFLYYFGIDEPGLAGIIDIDHDRSILLGDDVDMEDIIWMGPQQTVSEKAALTGASLSRPFADIADIIRQAQAQGQTIHFFSPVRLKQRQFMAELLGISTKALHKEASLSLIKAIIAQRSLKDEQEIAEIEKAHSITRHMHLTAMHLAAAGVKEQHIAGTIEGIALSGGAGVSFPVILSVRGEILHNHGHANIMQDGQLLVNDSGAESNRHYAADITRTIPVSGTFTQRQRDIYQIVLDAQMQSIEAIKPQKPYKEVHLLAARIIAGGLKSLGLMKGDVDEAVAAGAHALFFPHGLGHMMGLDVHDMENLGEDYVGYDDTVSRSGQFGLAYLRLAKKLQPGYVLTVEPGIYFIPALVQQWQQQKKHSAFINYDKVQEFIGFGGIRIEDDVLVTAEGRRVLGAPIPKHIDELEAECQKE